MDSWQLLRGLSNILDGSLESCDSVGTPFGIPYGSSGKDGGYLEIVWDYLEKFNSKSSEIAVALRGFLKITEKF